MLTKSYLSVNYEYTLNYLSNPMEENNPKNQPITPEEETSLLVTVFAMVRTTLDQNVEILSILKSKPIDEVKAEMKATFSKNYRNLMKEIEEGSFEPE
jgi:hypothetical protein